MPIDSTDDVEVVETQIDAGLEKGDQVDRTIEDVDPDLTKEEMALSNMMKEDDGGLDDTEDGDISTSRETSSLPADDLLRVIHNYVRDGDDEESVLDIASDEARIRLRQHILSETEKRGETTFSKWESLSPEERMANLKRVLEIEQEIHPSRRDRDETTLGQFEDNGYDYGRSDGQRIEINSTLVSQGDALQNVNVLYHESKHVDQSCLYQYLKEQEKKQKEQKLDYESKDVDLSNSKDDSGNAEAISYRAKIIKEEWEYSPAKYEEKYESLFIEAEARTAGRNGAEALRRVLSEGVEEVETQPEEQ